MVEDESFPTMEEIVSRSNFSKKLTLELESTKLEMEVKHFAALGTKYDIPAHVDLVPAGDDVIQVYRPGYCAFYAYPLHIGYSLPLPPLAEEFCRYYHVFTIFSFCWRSLRSSPAAKSLFAIFCIFLGRASIEAR